MQTPSPAYVRGIDVSYAQGAIDWQAVAKAGVVFGVARATQGVNIRDNTFAHNWPAMRSASVLRSAYHFAVPGQTAPLADDASRQAQAFVAAVNAAGGYDADLPCVLDLEENPNKLAPPALRDWAEMFCSVVDHLLGVTGPRATMLYSGEDFLKNMQVVPSPLANRALWLAWPQNTPVPDIGPWMHWTALQTSWTGHIPGVNGAVDTDLWALTADEMRAMYGKPAAAPAPSGPKLMLWQHQVFEAVAQALAQQYGWKAGNALADVSGASAVLCIGGAPDWIAQAKAACKGTWHEPLASHDVWHTLALVAQAGIAGRF